MKSSSLRPLVLSVLCVFAFAGVVSAQAPAPADFGKMMRSKSMRKLQQNAAKTALRSFWNGGGSSLMFQQLILQDADFREGFSISEEQRDQMGQKMTETMQKAFMNDPKFKTLQAQMQKLQDPADPFLENAPEEKQQEFAQLQEKITDIAIRRMNEAIEGEMTPEQKRKMKEFQISTMSEIPIVSPDMFEALDLSEQQRQQLNGIKKELEPEFERNMDDIMDVQFRALDKAYDILDKEGGEIKSPQDFQEKLVAAHKRVQEENPEFKDIEKNIVEKGRAFSEKLKYKMFDVLTDEQMERMGQLIDNPPDYVKKMLAKMKERRGASGGSGGDGAWQPGLDSWKPGDPIPEEYKKQRKERRFPSKS